MLKKLNKFVILTVFAALILRLIGITYGFPFIFHPDEPSVIRSALGIRFNPNPEHFDWPHLYFYLNYFIYMVFGKVRGVIGFLQNTFPILWDDEIIFYLLTRILSAILGALTVIPVYLTGKNLINQKVGLLSALIFALIPFHIKHSHYALIDVPMLFFLSWSLYFASQIYLLGNYKDYLLSGLFAGLAASTKYNGALIILSIILAHAFRVFHNKEPFPKIKNIYKLALAGFTSIAGFLIGTPYALIDYKTFFITSGPKGALWQFANVGKVSFFVQIQQFMDALFFKISDDLGYTFLILFIIGLCLVALKTYRSHLAQLLFLVVPAVVFLFYVSGFERNRSHYYFIAYPFIAIIAGFALEHLITILKKKNLLVQWGVIGIIFLIPLILACVDDYSFTQKDTRVQLYDWLQNNVNQKDYLVYGDNTVQQITDKFDHNVSSKLSNTTQFLSSQGYVIVDVNDKSVINAVNYPLKEEISFAPKLSKGPSIKVYSFGKND